MMDLALYSVSEVSTAAVVDSRSYLSVTIRFHSVNNVGLEL